jgi:hypothetical protein
MAGPYLNDPGYEVPENKILTISNNIGDDGNYKNIVKSLKGNIKRDWFNSHFYYCLPINIGNQYGFVIESIRDFEVEWDGTYDKAGDVAINFLNEDNSYSQFITSSFGNGVLTIQNDFSLKTPPGINLMTIQPPNMYIPGMIAMTGVIETDQIRRDFTFNLKITHPKEKIVVKKGDPLGAFIPIPRYFVDNFEVDNVDNYFDQQLHLNEKNDGSELARQRANEDKQKPHESGRKYFNGEHAFGERYSDHQKRM